MFPHWSQVTILCVNLLTTESSRRLASDEENSCCCIPAVFFSHSSFDLWMMILFCVVVKNLSLSNVIMTDVFIQ